MDGGGSWDDVSSCGLVEAIVVVVVVVMVMVMYT